MPLDHQTAAVSPDGMLRGRSVSSIVSGMPLIDAIVEIDEAIAMLAAADAILERQHGAALAHIGDQRREPIALLLELAVLAGRAQTQQRADRPGCR